MPSDLFTQEKTTDSFVSRFTDIGNEVISWVTWPSKEARDAGWKALMEDPRMHPDNNPMPFDGKRLIYGGFNTILDE